MALLDQLLGAHALELAQRIARIGNWDWNPTTNRFTMSNELCRLVGVRPQDFANATPGRGVHLGDDLVGPAPVVDALIAATAFIHAVFVALGAGVLRAGALKARAKAPFFAARSTASRVEITDVDSTGLPDTPLLGSQLTLTASVALAGLQPSEVVVQAMLGRVDGGDTLIDPQVVPMTHVGAADGGPDGALEVFSATTPLPIAGSVGYTVRVLPHNDLLAGDNELGLVRLA